MADKTLFYRFAHTVSRAAGRPMAFAAAVGVVLVWAVSGPIFGYSETWQLVINTGTTIITFLMVFLLQYTQNRDGEAVQAKLDELILVTRASNTFIGAETLTDQELKHLRDIVAEKARQHDGEHRRGNRKDDDTGLAGSEAGARVAAAKPAKARGPSRRTARKVGGS